MQVCTTLGMLTPEQAKQLREAGLTAYNHNLDTSPEYYSKITSSRKYEVRISCPSNFFLTPFAFMSLSLSGHLTQCLQVSVSEQAPPSRKVFIITISLLCRTFAFKRASWAHHIAVHVEARNKSACVAAGSAQHTGARAQGRHLGVCGRHHRNGGGQPGPRGPAAPAGHSA